LAITRPLAAARSAAASLSALVMFLILMMFRSTNACSKAAFTGGGAKGEAVITGMFEAGTDATDAIVADVFLGSGADVVAFGTIVGIAVVVFTIGGEVVAIVVTTMVGIVVVVFALTGKVVTGRFNVVGITVVTLANGVVLTTIVVELPADVAFTSALLVLLFTPALPQVSKRTVSTKQTMKYCLNFVLIHRVAYLFLDWPNHFIVIPHL